MDDPSLDIIVPEIYRALGIQWLTDIRTFRTEAEEILRGLPNELRKKALRYRREDDHLRCGNYVVLAEADCPVGVDTERVDDIGINDKQSEI